MSIMRLRFTASDFYDSSGRLVANCGPGALAAIADMSLKELMRGIPDFKKTGRLSPDRMKSELTRLGLNWKPYGEEWPSHGLVLIAWMGRCAGDPQLRIAYDNINGGKHWIAVSDGGRLVFDPFATNKGWLAIRDWKRHVLPELTGHRDLEWPICRVNEAISVEARNG